jgi:hypothetical protein
LRGTLAWLQVIKWSTVATCLRWWIKGMFAIPLTKGFADRTRRLTHYGDHAKDFGAADDVQYEQMADIFLGRAVPAGAFECYRIGGDLVRYDPATNELGILAMTGTIHTYFKPKFCRHATPLELAQRKCHKQKTHLDYVKKLCTQTFPII